MAKKKAKKKVSIREFVSEEELKFQLYYLKYSGLYRDILTLDETDILVKYTTKRKKRIKLMSKQRDKAYASGEDEIGDIIQKNIDYVTLLTPYYTKEKVFDEFIAFRQEFIDYLNVEIKDTNLPKHREMLEYAVNVLPEETPSKTRFGIILLLMIKNIATMPSYSGYTENWKTDFYSNAVEKVLLYVHNFDENLLSKRSGKKSKAFAYVTQICTNAFLQILNERKDEINFLSDTISLETANIDGVRSKISQGELGSTYTENELGKYSIQINENDDISTLLRVSLKYIVNSNKIYADNKSLESEITYLDKVTSKKDKDKDYDIYIKEIRDQIRPYYETEIIDTIELLSSFYSIVPGEVMNKINNEEQINIIFTTPRIVQQIEEIPLQEEEVFDEWNIT